MKKKMVAPIVVAILLVVYFVGYAAAVFVMPELPAIVKIFGVVVPLILAGYALWAAKERIEEIKGGEENDLSQY